MAQPLRNVASMDLTTTSLTDILTASSASREGLVLRSLVVCNRSGASTSFRFAVSTYGAAIANKHYLFYDLPLIPNDTFTSELLIGVTAGDIVRFRAANANVLTVNLYAE